MKTEIIVVAAVLTVAAAGSYGMRQHAESVRWQAEHDRRAGELVLLRIEIGNDRTEVRDQELKLEIAENKGKYVSRVDLEAAQTKLQAAELQLKLVEDLDAMQATMH